MLNLNQLLSVLIRVKSTVDSNSWIEEEELEENALGNAMHTVLNEYEY